MKKILSAIIAVGFALFLTACHSSSSDTSAANMLDLESDKIDFPTKHLNIWDLQLAAGCPSPPGDPCIDCHTSWNKEKSETIITQLHNVPTNTLFTDKTLFTDFQARNWESSPRFE